MKELKIDEELRDLLPPLTEDEYNQLEKNITTKGFDKNCPIITWNGYIVDGHNRYEICKKHNMDFVSGSLAYNTKQEVMEWMIDTQLGRRNLTPIQRIAVVKKYEDKIRKQAKEKQLSHLKQNNDDRLLQLEQTEKESPIHTGKELAKLAKVGSGTMARYNVVMNSDDEEIKEKMLKEEITITKAYEEVKKKDEPKEEINNEIIIENRTKKCLKCKKIKSVSEFSGNNDFCDECIENIYTPLQNNNYSNTDVGEIIKELKTPKLASDYIIVKNELQSIKDDIEERIELAEEHIFERYDLPSKMTTEEKQIALDNFEYLNSKLNQLIIKIKNIKIKEIN